MRVQPHLPVSMWKGVTFYLTSQVVDETLQFIKSGSKPGSSACIDCFTSSPDGRDGYGTPAGKVTDVQFRSCIDGMTMEREITYRKMRRGEEGKVFELVKAVFEEYVLPDVTPEGAKEFFRAAKEMIYKRPANHFILVAESEGEIAGMIDVRDHSHVSLFFVEKALQRKGVGRVLLVQATAECKAGLPGLSHLEVNSSLHSVPIYKKLGFVQSDKEQFVDGIRFVPMVKKLN